MDTKALRQKILDLAIRGKLVPQDSNDEPASILLEHIRQQKQQMVKDGKLKAKDIKNDTVIFVGEDNLHYEKFADGSVKCIEGEIPFELPEGWSWSRLVSLTSIITKGASPKWQGVDYTSSGTMFITSENVGVETLLLESPKFLPEKINEIQPRSILETHDILTNIVGASIGRTCEYTLVDSANTNQAVAIIRLIAVDMVSYVVKCLNSDYCVNLMFANQVNVARANLSLSSLANFLIPIPPLKEMYRIIAHLDCSLRHISGIQSSEDELRQLILFTKTKILDLAIRGKLVPQNPDDEPASVLLERIRAEKEELIKQGKIKRDKKDSVIFKGEDNSYYQRVEAEGTTVIQRVDVPSTWEVCYLQDISYPISSIGMQIKSEEIQKDGLFPVISQGKSYIDGYCSDESKVIYDFPIILFGDHTRNVKYINFPFIVGADGTKLHKIIQVNEKYVYYWMCHASEHIADKGYARHYNLLQKKCFMLPPFAEQNRIVNCIEKLFAQLNSICDALS